MKQFILFARVYTWLCLLIPIVALGQINDNPYPNYVVIGAFANQKNAVRFTNDANKNKFPARYEMNHNRNLYYVYVLTTDDREYAIAEALKLREKTKYFDTWVYSGSFDLMEITPDHQNQDVNPLTGKKIDAVTNVEESNEGGNDANLTEQVLNYGVTGNENGNNALANTSPGENTKTSIKQSSRRQKRQFSKARTKGADPASETTSTESAALQQSSAQLTSNGQPAGEPVNDSNKAAVAAVGREGQQLQRGKENTGSSENVRAGVVSTATSDNKEQNGTNGAGKNASRTTGAEGQPIEGDPSLHRTGIASTGKANEKTNDAAVRKTNGKTTSTTTSGSEASNANELTTGTTSANFSTTGTTTAGEKSGNQNRAGTGQNISTGRSTKEGRSIKSETASTPAKGNRAKGAEAGKTNASNSETEKGGNGDDVNQSLAQQDVGGKPLSNNTTTRTSETTTSSASKRDETAKKSQSTASVNPETSQGRAQQKTGDREKSVNNSDPVAVNADQLKATESITGTAGRRTSETSQKENMDLAEPAPVVEADSATAVRTVPERIPTEPLKAEEVVGRSFYFQLYRADNREVVEGEVDAIDFERARRMATYPGNAPVKILLPQGKSKQISFVCQVFGYRKLQKEFTPAAPADDLYLDENGNVVVSFELIRLQKGDIAIMYNVFFFKDAAVMRPESRFEVNNLLDLLNENPSYKIRIHGHTNGNNAGKIIRMNSPDNFYSLTQTKEGFGSAKKLSEERAIVIRNYLISNGISADRMQVKAWGGKKPIHDKHAARAQENVRVEIEILSEP
jgi:outer membrane protein OmpA-like peptidoglycan-associated protein